MSAEKNVRSLFAGAALLAAGTMIASAGANAFTVGSQGGGYEDEKAFVELEDNEGQQIRIWLPPRHDPGFEEAALDIMRDYVSWKDMNMEGYKAAGFIMVLDILADYSHTTAEEFVDEIGLDSEVYSDLLYKRERAFILSDYYGILNAARISDPWSANQRLRSNGDTIRAVNERMAAAAEQYPDDPSFQLPPLTAEDLRNIRRNAAWVNFNYIQNLFEMIDSGQLDENMLPDEYARQLDQIVNLLYREIRKDPADIRYEWDIAVGNEYNREMLAFIDEELAAWDIDREQFYQRLTELWGHYNRYYDIMPGPPQPQEVPPDSPADPSP